MKELTTKEINLVLEKIRSKYETIIRDYGKNPNLLERFQERYITALKQRKNITVFLMAEIEAVEEIVEQEGKKRDEETRKKEEKSQPSFVDRIMAENQKRYRLYHAVELSPQSEEEINYLCGAAREFLNEFFPLSIMIAKETVSSVLVKKLNECYDELSAGIGYYGIPPMAKHYITTIETVKDSNRMIFEYQRLIQNIGFLLNRSLDSLKQLISQLESSAAANQSVSSLIKRLNPSDKKSAIWKGKSYTEAVIFIINHLDLLIRNFRLRDIRKS